MRTRLGMNPYSADLCRKIIVQLERGVGPSEVARNLEVHRSTAYRAWWRYQQRGQAAGRKPGGHRCSQLKEHHKQVEKWVEAQPDITLQQLRDRCLKQLGLQLHISSIARFVKQLGYSFKKNASGQRTRTR